MEEPALEGKRRQQRRSRTGATAAAIAAAALALGLSACGGGGSSADSNEAPGKYPVKIVSARFPTDQRLGQTTLLQLSVRNTGHRTVPGLSVTFTVGGKEGRASMLPFGYRDPSPGLAQPDRPVWVLSARYPKANGSTETAGAETASPKTFDFGPLKPGKTLEAVWKLNAVRAGKYNVLYEVNGGLGGTAQAQTAPGTQAGGSFATEISDVPPETEVTDSGEVIEIQGKANSGK